MCVEAVPKSKCGGKSSCGCGGHGHNRTAGLNPRTIRTIKFGGVAGHQCSCSGGGRCPREYLAPTGYVLGRFLILHLVVNSLALWPGKFQSAVNRVHSLGALLPVLEIGLIAVLTFHIAVGLRLMRRDKLKFITGDHFHGSPMRQWLQRVTAMIMLAFILFHVVALHRWFGGRFDPHNAFNSASHAIWQFWRGQSAGSFPNSVVRAILSARHCRGGLSRCQRPGHRRGSARLDTHGSGTGTAQENFRLRRAAAPARGHGGVVGAGGQMKKAGSLCRNRYFTVQTFGGSSPRSANHCRRK